MHFKVNGLKLVGNYKNGNRGSPQVLIIHGGGLKPNQADIYLEWQNILAERGIGSFVFNHGGILPSEGETKNTTLESRLLEARAAADFFLKLIGEKSLKFIVAGVSMGGHIAAQLASEIQPRGLILYQPGSFVEEAENKPFGPLFTKALRAEKDWETIATRSFKSIGGYRGDILLIVPENDDVVPRSVFQRYFREARQARAKEFYLLKGATHHYFRRSDPSINPKWREDFYKK